MQPEQLEIMWGISKEYLQKTFGPIAKKVRIHVHFWIFFNTLFLVFQHGFSLVPVLMKPKSRGRVSLKSTNPFRWPRMESGLFSDPEDIKVLIKGIRMAIKVSQQDHFRAIGTRLNPYPFVGCEKLEFNSDSYWECVLRHVGTTLQHQVGTCKMGPYWDEEAVVNPELQVIGVQNLRVVDTSIIPEIIAGHPNSVAMMIAEKAADMIKSYWNNHIRK